MYKTILVKNLVEQGERLVERLESRRLQVVAAFWYYMDDRWRLVIVAPAVEREGPLRMYARIQEALAQMNATELVLSDITVMRPNGYEFKELRSTVERTGRLATRRSANLRRDIAPEETYIYRWRNHWTKSHPN